MIRTMPMSAQISMAAGSRGRKAGKGGGGAVIKMMLLSAQLAQFWIAAVCSLERW